jgi:small subunit ribosomal protein S18
MPGGRRDRNSSRDSYDKSEGKGGMRMRRARKKVCSFCVDKATDIDYKEVVKIRKYVSERGKILPRRISGNCAKHQRQLTVAIKRARHIALLPYTAE